jgi:hypothetical protein
VNELQREAVEALLVRSGRDFLPVRRSFLQTRGARKGPSSLSAFGKRESAFDLYMLIHALASQPPWDVAFPARIWARLLGAPEGPTGTTLVSRQWTWLEEQQLVATSRTGRLRRITLLKEDGSGDPYSHPGVIQGSNPAEGDYFRVPYVYWRSAFDLRLSLSGKMVLLIGLSLSADFILPVEHAARWYGLSSTRIHDGLKELRTFGLLGMRVESRKAPLTERGVTFERHYRMLAPFADSDRDRSDTVESA